MKRPNLMVGTIIRKKYRKKYKRKPLSSSSVKYFNSLENRAPKASIKETELYEKWTKAIRRDMERRHIWPTGLEEWTQETISEYVRRLQNQFWKSTGVKKSLIVENKYHVLIQILNYPRKDYPQGHYLLRVFRAIYKYKIRRYIRRMKICDLSLWSWQCTPIRAATFSLDWKPRNIIKIEPDEYI